MRGKSYYLEDNLVFLGETAWVISQSQDGSIHEFRAKKYTVPMKLKNIIEVPIKEKAYYILQKTYNIELPFIINKFLASSIYKVIDIRTDEVIAWSKSINRKKYNFIFIDTGYFLRGKSCKGKQYFNLLEVVIKGESNAK